MAVKIPLFDAVADKEGIAVEVKGKERVVVALCDCTTVTDGFPLWLASEAVPVTVYTATDGVHHAEELANPVLDSTGVGDTAPLTDVLDVSLPLPEELGHRDGDTEKDCVAEDVGEITPELDTVEE